VNVLDWDSAFFGLPIARADVDRDPGEAVERARAAGVACLYLFVPATALEAVSEAISRGALLTDLRLVLERAGAVEGAAAAGGAGPARRAGEADLPILEELAARLAAHSRFSRDPRFARERVEEMYRLRVRRCLAEGVVTLPAASARSGFAGVRVEDGVARVELVYVEPERAGAGVARALVAAALRAVAAPRAEVVTQLGNVPALRTYEALGFRVRSATTILHAWLVPPD